MTTVAVLGAGKIGQTVLAGLCRAGWAPGDLIAVVRAMTNTPALVAEAISVLSADSHAAADAKAAEESPRGSNVELLKQYVMLLQSVRR